MLKHVFIAVILIASTACASTVGPRFSGNDRSPSARLYGDYLAASYASYLNDADARSTYYSRAFALRPEDLVLGRKSMVSALNAGDDVLARTLAIKVHVLDKSDGLSRAILGAHALRGGKYNQAVTYLDNSNDGIGLEDINALMRGWAKVGLGEKDTGLETFETLEGGKYFELLGTLQKAKLYAQNGEVEKAGKAFAMVNEVGISSIETVLSEARLFMAQGEKDKALTRLNVFADKNDGALTGPVRGFIDDLEAGRKVRSSLTPAESASRALTEPAFGYYGAQRQYEAAEIFLRLALELDPDNDKARLFLGSIMEDVQRADNAMVQYKMIGPDSPYTVSARLSEANLLFDEDKDDEAIKTLKATYKTHPSKITQSALGRAYLIMEDYENALPYYEALIKEATPEALEKDPQYLYLRGISLERLGRWEEAVKDLEFVLKHQPDNADALNYLGYTWVDKGVELTKAFEMIRKAVKLQPKSGAIIDSLGWAHYKLGQYNQARVQLEAAAERSPSSATIIDHLGDVYWKLGRFREAGYQWGRALELDPTDKERKTIKAKLKGGLSAADTIK